jgi:diaminopimelate dehydrogenase
MINAAIVGYGNIGKFAMEAILEAPDFNLAGVVRRKESLGSNPPELNGVKVTADIKELGKVDVAILASPSRSVPEEAKKYLALGINTIDSYDIHTGIWDLRQQLTPVAKANNAVAVISCGWDPGSDSVIRALFEAAAPKGVTHTNFGEGMSMGHTVAVKSKEGVKNAMSITIPRGTGIHARLVYVELEKGADFSAVEKSIKTDPYFVHDETRVVETKDVNALIDLGHGVNLVRKGVSGRTHNQIFKFEMRANNPALTSQVMVSCARASMKRQPGAYTMIEIPVADFLYGETEELIKRLV